MSLTYRFFQLPLIIALSATCSTEDVVAQNSQKPANIWTKRYRLPKPQMTWSALLKWLQSETGMPVVVKDTTKHRLDLNQVVKLDAKATLAELIDRINKQRDRTHFFLFVARKKIVVHAVDLPIDRKLIERVQSSELKNRGPREYVETVLRFRVLLAVDVEEHAKKLLGPFGTTIALPSSNVLIIRDFAENLDRVASVFEASDKKQSTNCLSYTHKCKYIRVKYVTEKLREYLASPITIKNKKPAQQKPNYYLSYDEKTNCVFITGKPKIIVKAKQFIRNRDVGAQTPLKGEKFLAQYPVKNGKAKSVVTAINSAFKDKENYKVVAVGHDCIMVYGHPEDHFAIAKYIQSKGQLAKRSMTLGPFKNLRAADLAVFLRRAFKITKNELSIDVNAKRNQITIECSPRLWSRSKRLSASWTRR